VKDEEGLRWIMIINLHHGWVYAPLLYRSYLYLEAHRTRGSNSDGVCKMSAISGFSGELPTSGTLDPERGQPPPVHYGLGSFGSPKTFFLSRGFARKPESA
jgi:hypothetical protein